MQSEQRGAEGFAYVYRLGREAKEVPKELDGFPTRIITTLPEPPPGPFELRKPEALQTELGVSEALQMTASNRERLAGLNKTFPVIRGPGGYRALAGVCGNHEAIGTVIPGVPLQSMDTVGTWVSMAIAERGIDELQGWVFTTFSTIAAQTFEVLVAYSNGGLVELAVFDWSCVDSKDGLPPCDPSDPWVYNKPLSELPRRYKFYYWDCCRWQKALALANKSRYVLIDFPLPPPLPGKIRLQFYLNEAKILNWDSLQWETFWARAFTQRDAQPPRPWGPTAFVEFISDAGCPDIPRLGFREVRFLPAGGIWQDATPSNSTMRSDLPNYYRYCLFDPNHTWCICLK